MRFGRISLSVFLTVSVLIKLFISNIIRYLYSVFSSTHSYQTHLRQFSSKARDSLKG